MKKWKVKIINTVTWLLQMDTPKIHVYTFQKVFDKEREVPLSSMKKEFQDGLLRYVEHNKLVDLTMSENKEYNKVTFKISINGKK